LTAVISPGASRFAGRRLLLPAVLAASLALNLCFVGGALWIRLHGPSNSAGPAEFMREMAAALNLDPQQRAAFERYFRTMRARTQLMHEEVEPLIGDAWTEVAKPQPDEAQVMRLFDAAADKRRAYQRETTTQTIAFLAGLSPEQRQKFVEIARQHHPPPWSERLKRGISP